MGQYGITGWSGGARVTLTYNLKAGQMRGMGRCYIFPNNTYVNNNFYGANYDYGCNCNSNKTPGWMNWMMGSSSFKRSYSKSLRTDNKMKVVYDRFQIWLDNSYKNTTNFPVCYNVQSSYYEELF